jgi:hypothetical protein
LEVEKITIEKFGPDPDPQPFPTGPGARWDGYLQVTYCVSGGFEEHDLTYAIQNLREITSDDDLSVVAFELELWDQTKSGQCDGGRAVICQTKKIGASDLRASILKLNQASEKPIEGLEERELRFELSLPELKLQVGEGNQN